MNCKTIKLKGGNRRKHGTGATTYSQLRGTGTPHVKRNGLPYQHKRNRHPNSFANKTTVFQYLQERFASKPSASKPSASKLSASKPSASKLSASKPSTTSSAARSSVKLKLNNNNQSPYLGLVLK